MMNNIAFIHGFGKLRCDGCVTLIYWIFRRLLNLSITSITGRGDGVILNPIDKGYIKLTIFEPMIIC